MTTALEGDEGSALRPGRTLPPGKTRYPLYRRLGGPVWTGVKNLAPTEIRSPDRPARSQSLYRLSYPAHHSRHNRLEKNYTKVYEGSRGIAPFILNPACKWGDVPKALLPRKNLNINWTVSARPQSRSRRFGEEKIMFLLQRIETQSVQSVD
jgi:hypothetical protein